MTLLSRSRLLLVLLASLGLVVAGSIQTVPDKLEAGPNDPFLDTDGDLLPDVLEWVLMSDPWSADSDNDGVDDFLEAVQHQIVKPGPSPTTDHEFRSTTHIVRLPDNTQHVIVNLMFRIVNGDPAEVSSLDPEIYLNGIEIPFASMFMAGLAHIGMINHPTEGLYVLLSSRLCSPDELRPLLPCSIGSSAVIGGRSFNSGCTLFDGDGTTVSLVEIQNNHFGLHPIDSEFLTDPKEPRAAFWSKSRVCEMELVVTGVGQGYALAQVVEAACTGAPSLACAPSCDSWRSRLVVIPDGLRFFTGP